MIVKPVTTERELSAFLELPYLLYAGDAAFVPPLRSREAWRLDPVRNPFFSEAQRELFVAWRDGQAVGRLAAVHDRRRRDGAGIVGFFECEDDDATAGALFDAASAWLRAKGCGRCLGPINLSMNDEFGVVVDGHDRRPPLMTAHTARWYPRLFERAGFRPERDGLCYERQLLDESGAPLALPPGLLEAAQPTFERAELAIRPVVRAKWDEEVVRAHAVLNASFQGEAWYEPIGLGEFRAIARGMKDLLVPELMLFAETEAQAVGFSFLFPDANEVLAQLNGGLWPLGWLKALWAQRRVSTVSFKLAGVVPTWRKSGLAARLALESSLAAQRLGYRRMEMSVISESNHRMREFIELQGGTPYLRLRLFQKELRS